jgi:hypothetical protein
VLGFYPISSLPLSGLPGVVKAVQVYGPLSFYLNWRNEPARKKPNHHLEGLREELDQLLDPYKAPEQLPLASFDSGPPVPLPSTVAETLAAVNTARRARNDGQEILALRKAVEAAQQVYHTARRKRNAVRLLLLED